MKHFISILLIMWGVCGYAQQRKNLPLKKYLVANLSDSLQENSGLDFLQGALFTFNDGGNSSEIFKISEKNGKIEKTYSTGLPNRDWEAITSDNEHLYIGDFGNNGGSRKDLIIYKIPFQNGNFIKDSIEKIPFYYPEQTDFSFRNLNTDFDAESMIFLNGKIHIFTKEWQSKGVSHYTIEPNPNEKNPAKKLEYFRTKFMVTDVAYHQKKLYLVGYTRSLKVFLHIFEEMPNGLFFNGKHTKYKLGNALKIGQIEGISVNENGIFISSEKFRFPIKNVPPSFYYIPFQALK